MIDYRSTRFEDCVSNIDVVFDAVHAAYQHAARGAKRGKIVLEIIHTN